MRPSDENEDARRLIDDLLQLNSVPEVLESLKTFFTTSGLYSVEEFSEMENYVKTRSSVSPHKHVHKDYYTIDLYTFISAS
jgi:hypothetical protein